MSKGGALMIIRVSTDNIVSVHEFPDGSHTEQNNALKELIGCDIYEHVMPRGLYTFLGHSRDVKSGKCVGMLVDEEGLLKTSSKINFIGTHLYFTYDMPSPIVGNILFVGEKYEDDGIEFCDLDEDVCKRLLSQLKNIIEFAKEEN